MNRSGSGFRARGGRLRSSFVVVAAVLIASACGSDDDGDSTDTTQASVTTATAVSPGSSTGTQAPETTEALAAAGAGISDAMIAAAKDEGRLVLYTTLVPADNDRLIAAFNEEHPEISITVDRKTSALLDPQVEAEARTGTGIGDVYISSDTAWMRDNADLLVPLQSSWITDEAYEPHVTETRTGVLMQVTPYGFGWNTTAVPDGIASWEEIAELPDGLTIGTPDPRVAIATGGWGIYMKEVLGEEWLCSVLSRGPSFYSSGSAAAQALAAGEIDVLVPALSIVNELKADGAPVEAVFLPPMITAVLTGAVLKTAPHPNAAQLFVDFALSEKGQEVLNVDKMSILPNIPGTLGDASMSAGMIDMSTVSEAEHTAHLDWFDDCAGR